MRHKFIFVNAAAAVLLSACGTVTMTLGDRLATLPGATVKKIDNDTLFKEAYEINIFQPLDHKNPGGPGSEGGLTSFRQDFRKQPG